MSANSNTKPLIISSVTMILFSIIVIVLTSILYDGTITPLQEFKDAIVEVDSAKAAFEAMVHAGNFEIAVGVVSLVLGVALFALLCTKASQKVFHVLHVLFTLWLPLVGASVYQAFVSEVWRMDCSAEAEIMANIPILQSFKTLCEISKAESFITLFLLLNIIVVTHLIYVMKK